MRKQSLEFQKTPDDVSTATCDCWLRQSTPRRIQGNSEIVGVETRVAVTVFASKHWQWFGKWALLPARRNFMRESNPKSADHFTHSAPVAKDCGHNAVHRNCPTTKRGLTREPTECDKGSTGAFRIIRKPDRTRDG